MALNPSRKRRNTGRKLTPEKLAVLLKPRPYDMGSKVRQHSFEEPLTQRQKTPQEFERETHFVHAGVIDWKRVRGQAVPLRGRNVPTPLGEKTIEQVIAHKVVHFTDGSLGRLDNLGRVGKVAVAAYNLFVEVPPHFKPEPGMVHAAVIDDHSKQNPLVGRVLDLLAGGKQVAAKIVGAEESGKVRKLNFEGGAFATAFEFGEGGGKKLSVYMREQSRKKLFAK